MASPVEYYQPSIPSLIGFGHNLTQHETSLKPFLDSLPRRCRYIFEPIELKNRLSDQRYESDMRGFRQYIEHATAIKDAGNAAYASDDPAEAITQYAQAIEVLEKLLLKSISEEEERDRETRLLIAVCWANSSAAKMLEVPGNETNLEDARLYAKNAITSDPGYAKGYTESVCVAVPPYR
jgi:tetratricopeptide (TPR) repeat protein